MKFDRARNSAELREALDYLVCAAIAGGAAVISGISWLLCFAAVAWAAQRWKKKSRRVLHKQRGVVLVAAVACLLGLFGHWPDYREGVFRGYDAAASAASKEPNQSLQPTRLLLRSADKALSPRG